jgi:hypothetical protein
MAEHANLSIATLKRDWCKDRHISHRAGELSPLLVAQWPSALPVG